MLMSSATLNAATVSTFGLMPIRLALPTDACAVTNSPRSPAGRPSADETNARFVGTEIAIAKLTLLIWRPTASALAMSNFCVAASQVSYGPPTPKKPLRLLPPSVSVFTVWSVSGVEPRPSAAPARPMSMVTPVSTLPSVNSSEPCRSRNCETWMSA